MHGFPTQTAGSTVTFPSVFAYGEWLLSINLDELLFRGRAYFLPGRSIGGTSPEFGCLHCRGPPDWPGNGGWRTPAAERQGAVVRLALLSTGVTFTEDDAIDAFGRVWTELVARMKGDPWKLTDKVVADLRQKKYPNLLNRS